MNNQDIIKVVSSKIGAPYWFGTFGQIATAALLEAKRKQYPTHYTDTRMSKYRAQFNKQVFDCSGLIKYCLMTDCEAHALVYKPALDYSADSIYTKAAEKGPINTIPEIPGLGLYRSGHAGVYIGGGYLIEARGFDYGVVKSKLSERNFTCWYKIPGVDYLTSWPQTPNNAAIAAELRRLADLLD